VQQPDVKQLEGDLWQLEGMRARGCCLNGAQIDHVDEFLRQYFGIVSGGRRYIYINAFPASEFKDWPKQVPVFNWRMQPFVACDGGSGFWGVLYDPASRRFSQLAFNGIG
jgi:hypothetical protein